MTRPADRAPPLDPLPPSPVSLLCLQHTPSLTCVLRCFPVEQFQSGDPSVGPFYSPPIPRRPKRDLRRTSYQ